MPLSVPGGGGGEASANYARILHTTPANTGGGATLANTWQIRPLNTLAENVGGIVTATSFPQFTLAAGEYTFRIVSVAFATLRMRTRLRDITNGILYYSDTAWPPAGQHSPCWITGQFTLAAPAQFQVEQIGLQANPIYGWGKQVEFDTEISIFCVAEFFQAA